LFTEATRQGLKQIQEARPKFLLVHSSSGHKQALSEILQEQAIQMRLADTKYAKEAKALDQFFQMLHTDVDRAYVVCWMLMIHCFF
jgi:protein pelota